MRTDVPVHVANSLNPDYIVNKEAYICARNFAGTTFFNWCDLLGFVWQKKFDGNEADFDLRVLDQKETKQTIDGVTKHLLERKGCCVPIFYYARKLESKERKSIGGRQRIDDFELQLAGACSFLAQFEPWEYKAYVHVQCKNKL